MISSYTARVLVRFHRDGAYDLLYRIRHSFCFKISSTWFETHISQKYMRSVQVIIVLYIISSYSSWCIYCNGYFKNQLQVRYVFHELILLFNTHRDLRTCELRYFSVLYCHTKTHKTDSIWKCFESSFIYLFFAFAGGKPTYAESWDIKD